MNGAVGYDEDHAAQPRRSHLPFVSRPDAGLRPASQQGNQFPAWTTCTILSRTRMVPVRAAPGLAATVNDTGLSPRCGIDVVIVIHGTFASAVHKHRSCSAPPHVSGSLCW